MAVSATPRQRSLAPARPLLSAGWMHVSHGVWAFFAGWFGFLSVDPSTGVSRLWMVHSTMYVAFAMSSHRDPDRPVPSLWATTAVTFGGFVLGGLAAGAPLLSLLGFGAANVLVAACAIWFYQFRGIVSWVPRNTQETIRLMLSLLAATVLGALVGAYPSSGLRPDMDLQHTIWAAARSYTSITIAANCIVPLYFTNSDCLPSRYPISKIVCSIPLGIACLALPVMFPSLAMSWLYAIPSLWAALVMTRRMTAAYTCTFTLVAVFVPYAAFPMPPLGGLLLPEAIVDVTFAFVSHLAMLIITLRDETTRVQQHMTKLAEVDAAHHEMFTSVIHSMADGLILTDRSGRVAMTNRAADSVAAEGIPEQLDIEWVRAFELQVVDAQRVVSEVLLQSLLEPERGAARQLEIVLPRPEGARRISVSSQDLPSGSERLTLLMFRDITAAQQRQQELESFAGTVAHDLKGPLTSLNGWLEAAVDELADRDVAAGRMALARAHHAVERMRVMIDEYLAYTVSQGGELRITDVDLARIVGEIVSVYSATAGPTFDVDIHHVLRTDASLTRQLMANIIGNGVKYVREGEQPYIQVNSVDGVQGWTEVHVADRGRGLQPGDEERIFGRLNRSDKDARMMPGIGLGLALCHAIVTRHGGQIRAENNEWGGATFRFTLPTVGAAT